MNNLTRFDFDLAERIIEKLVELYPGIEYHVKLAEVVYQLGLISQKKYGWNSTVIKYIISEVKTRHQAKECNEIVDIWLMKDQQQAVGNK